LRRAGYAVRLVRFRDDSVSSLPAGPLLLRLSDPVMLRAVRMLTRAARSFLGPGPAVMERCYDKYEAHRVAIANGADSPPTALASEASTMPFPLVLKPRRGSDSIGVRLLREGPIPSHARTDGYIAQQHVRGAELTVAVFRDRAGMPLRIVLPEATPHSFLRKYLLRPRRTPLADAGLAERVRRSRPASKPRGWVAPNSCGCCWMKIADEAWRDHWERYSENESGAAAALMSSLVPCTTYAM
jgi:ATP-grasp domain